MAIQYKTLDQIKLMREAGKVVGETLELIKAAIEPGVTTNDLDRIAEDNLRKHGATSSFKGYHGFPATICASVNDEVVHGIPGERIIREGDVVSIDFGAIVEGWHGDAAFTYVVPPQDGDDVKLSEVCEESLWRGIAAARVGGRLTDISHEIEKYINSQGKYGILREYGGHGIGSEMHMEPHVLNYGRRGFGAELVSGMTLAIEPMITRGTERMRVMPDNWTVSAMDGSRGAHWEHTFALLEDGNIFVLTALDGGRDRLGKLGIEISHMLD
ncbi:MAG: type I methionyl aminopeptidase [Candidatus Nanopelagicaceae bacterium]